MLGLVDSLILGGLIAGALARLLLWTRVGESRGVRS